MKTLKRWMLYLKVFIKNVLERMTNLLNNVNDANAEVEIAKIEARKEIIIAGKDLIITAGKGINDTIKNIIKTPFKDKRNMRITGVMMIGVGGAFIIVSYIK